MTPEREAVAAALTAKLKGITTWIEFQTWEKEVQDCSELVKIVGKRRNCQVYAFSHLYDTDPDINPFFYHKERYLNVVHYLYDDSVSTGKAAIKNLYRVIKVW